MDAQHIFQAAQTQCLIDGFELLLIAILWLIVGLVVAHNCSKRFRNGDRGDCKYFQMVVCSILGFGMIVCGINAFDLIANPAYFAQKQIERGINNP